MRLDILTVFPEMFESVLSSSILGRAAQKGILKFRVHNIRDYARNKHHNTDDYPFGGGVGMVMMPQPILDCLAAVMAQGGEAKKLYMSPRGRTLSCDLARELAGEERLVLLCGHYEGVDERALEPFEHVSIGDYVLTGGELAAMVLIDCVSRFVPGVLGSEESSVDESFSDGLLEYPQYTRPASYEGMDVPEVLLSGNHANIARWRREQSLRLTLENRPDLIAKAQLSDKDREFLKSLAEKGRES